MPDGPASFVHVPLAEFLAAGRSIEAKWKLWGFIEVRIEFAGDDLTITSGAGVYVLPARGKLAASAQMTYPNFMMLVNGLSQANDPIGEIDLAFLPSKKQLLTDKLEVMVESISTGSQPIITPLLSKSLSRGDYDHIYSEYYDLTVDDLPITDGLESVIRSILRKPTLKPQQIAQMAAFLYAVQRLPVVTEGVNMSISLVYRVGRESNYKQVHIDRESFRLESGGYAHEEGVGGDSFGGILFEAFAGGGRDGDSSEAMEFMEALRERAEDPSMQVEIDDNSDEPLRDWDQLMPNDL